MSALSTTARREYYCEIGNSLPPPVLHNQEYHDRRQTTGVEVFESLRPGDANEARLAVRIVLAGAHAAECLREAGVYRDDYAKRTRCRAQAAGMMRAEGVARRALAQEQKLRLAIEAVANAAQAQPVALSASLPQVAPEKPPPLVQTEAVVPSPVQAAAVAPPPVQSAPVVPEAVQAAAVAAAPVPAPPEAAAPLIHAAAATPPPAPVPPAVTPPPEAVTQPVPPSAAAGSAPPPSPEAIAKAEAYVEENLVAAAQIRHDRGVTPQSTAYFRHLTLPADPALIDALVRGSTYTLTLLDEIGGETLDVAA